MHALTAEQLMNPDFTKQLARKHNTARIEELKYGRGKGANLG
jgi:hypothetical protein